MFRNANFDIPATVPSGQRRERHEDRSSIRLSGLIPDPLNFLVHFFSECNNPGGWHDRKSDRSGREFNRDDRQ